jgi:hypothetical protein
MMSEDQTGSSKPADPFEMFRGMRDAYLDSVAKAMIEAVNTEDYAEATGAMLNNSLAVTAPYREAVEKSMLQALQQLSLPSRQDILALAERFTNLEMRLDDMDAKLDRIERQTHAGQSVAPTEPIRRRAADKASATKRGAPSKKAAPSNRTAKRVKR